MRRYYDSYVNHEKYKDKTRRLESKGGGFRCSHCKQFVVINDVMGTLNRNHCNMCLWSRHVDVNIGDRLSTCRCGMEPVGLTLKHEGFNKTGELMLIHRCLGCQKISINRIARDDCEQMILRVFDNSTRLNYTLGLNLKNQSITVLTDSDIQVVHSQLFGRGGFNDF